MNETLGQRITVGCLAVAVTVMLLLGAWAFIGLVADLQGGDTTAALAPTIALILLGAVSIILILWLIRMVRTRPAGAVDDEERGGPGGEPQ